MPSKTIHVAGDVCIDVLGVPQLRQSSDATSGAENWRLTGEIRTHYRRGGALLLTDMVAAAARSCTVLGPTPQTPEALRLGKEAAALDEALFPRLTRDEIVHSVIRVEEFRTSDADKKGKTLRVARTEGFSGPLRGAPALKVEPPASPQANIIVLDDAGNNFRPSQDQWPAAILRPAGVDAPLVVHKLHRPIPFRNSAAQTAANASLWETLAQNHPARRVVILSVEDLRSDDVLISRGLSWERTALDVVWQLSNLARWKALNELPHLIVRFGLDGALYWRGGGNDGQSDCRAWLVYSPDAIEGSWESSFEGEMVAYGSAFTAGLVKKFAESDSPNLLACTIREEDEEIEPPGIVIEGIRAGLGASRRLLQLGFGKDPSSPGYPRGALFDPAGEEMFFACQQIPIIPEAAVPDRGYWRLIDSIFTGKTRYLHRAVAQVARGARVSDTTPESEDGKAAKLLQQVPVAIFGALRAYDRREIESYRALYSLMADYVRQPTARRPLSVAVFGPPGAGKSFGVKMVAKALAGSSGRSIEELTFNLSQYKDPDELAAAFHLVRDVVLRGKIPLVFFDEFDTALAIALGWLRYLLSPMQDGEFVDRGTPHPIGQSIFVFAGGTRESYADFARPFDQEHSSSEDLRKEYQEFKDAKGPDFLSRLRGTLDIPGLDLDTKFDAYGPTEAFPSEAATLLRRANILAFQLRDKAPTLEDASKALQVSEPVIRALLHLPRFAHGNRSFEALLDMSHLVGEHEFTPSFLPCSNHSALHANSAHLLQLLATDFPFPAHEREEIAKAIHLAYLEDRKKDGSFDSKDRAMRDRQTLPEDLKESNRQQADHIAVKLRTAGLWFRKMHSGLPVYPDVEKYFASKVEQLAEMEHDRWVAEKRRAGWIPAPDMDRNSRDKVLLLHNSIVRWKQLTDPIKEYDRRTVGLIPQFLRAGGFEIYAPLDNDTNLPGFELAPESVEISRPPPA